MNRNKKFISLFCALAMMLTMLSGFTFANAAVNSDFEQGITLASGEVTETSAEVIVGYKGVPEGVSGMGIVFAVPENVTGVTVTSLQGAQIDAFVSDEHLVRVTVVVDSTAAELENYATLRLALSSPFTEDQVFTLDNLSYFRTVEGNQRYNVDPSKKNPIPATEVTVKKVEATPDPNATQAPATPTPAPTPDSTRAPEIVTPTKAPIVDVEKGITLKAGASTDTEAEVIVGYKGVPEGVSGMGIVFAVPENVTGVTVTSLQGAQIDAFVSDEHLVRVTVVVDSTAADLENYATLKLALSSPFTEDQVFTLDNLSYFRTVEGNERYNVDPEKKNPIPASNVIVPAKALSDEGFGGTAEGKDIKPDANKVDKMEGAESARLGVTVKKGDADAVYGTDYVAVYTDAQGNEHVLDAAQYSNFINGYLNAANLAGIVDTTVPSEAYKGLTIKTKSDDVTVEFEYVVINDDDTETVIPDDEKPVATDRPTTVKITQSAVSVRVNQVVVIAPTAKLGSYTVNKAKYTFDYSDPEKNDSDAYDKDKADDKKYFDFVGDRIGQESAKITGIKTTSNKTISVKIVGGSITYKDGTETVTRELTEKEIADAAPIDVKISVKSAVSGGSSHGGSGSSGDDDDSSNGPIAGAGQGTTSNPYVPGVGSNYYIDIDATPWAEAAINGLTAKGLLAGYGNGVFKPNNNVTRAEFAMMISKIFNVPAAASATSFYDVSTGDWFYNAVQACAAAGIVSGYGDGYFDPNRTISRQDMAVMVFRAARNCGKSDYIKPIAAERVFVDEYQIADYAKEAVKVLQMAGIISGMSETQYCPVEKATRAQAAVMLYPFSN